MVFRSPGLVASAMAASLLRSGQPAAPNDVLVLEQREQADADIQDRVNETRFAVFKPTYNPIRQTAWPAPETIGTRIRQGHNSRHRLEGSMPGFGFLDDRRELEGVADKKADNGHAVSSRAPADSVRLG